MHRTLILLLFFTQPLKKWILLVLLFFLFFMTLLEITKQMHLQALAAPIKAGIAIRQGLLDDISAGCTCYAFSTNPQILVTIFY